MSTVSTKSITPPTYPARLMIDYPDSKLNRLTSFFRVFVILPIWFIYAWIQGSIFTWGIHLEAWRAGLTMFGILFIPLLLMILFRKKYPKWWFDWNLALAKFNFRILSYLLLLRDEYPSTDEEQAVHLELIYPNVQKQLSRGMPLIKWFLAIPHYAVLFMLFIAVAFVSIIAWFSILFTGRYPHSLFNFTLGVMRWALRVIAFAYLLITDEYPKFSLDA
jgi:Domain of unknown function (DUF4389)